MSLVSNLKQRFSEANNPIQDGEHYSRMRELYVVREPLVTGADARRAAHIAARRTGGVARIFRRAGFLRVQVGE